MIASRVVELPKPSVLFVDDDLVLRKLFSRSDESGTVEDPRSCKRETALRCVDSEAYDLIFMDQHMASTEKQMLGTETVRALRAKGFKNTICGLSANDVEKELCQRRS
jgi:CheY-like chemotaxis protein